MTQSKDKRGRAEKRVLWEVRQRYNIGRPGERRARQATRRGGAAQASGGGSVRPPLANVSAARQPAPKRSGAGRWARRVVLALILAVALTGGVFGYKILAAGNKITDAERSIIGQLTDLLFSGDRQLNGEADGRVNILLLAVGGEGHQGENLADTIILASFQPTTNQVALLSIPRDMYVQVPGEDYYSKINAVHAYGESQKNGEGPRVLGRLVEDITGQPIHYYGRTDFIAFKQIVDEIGGVDITIENSFFDYWHKISFPAGTEHMDGERALAYARARYIEGPEGGDFKRAERAQQMLLAIRDEVFSVNTALDFTALSNILNSVSDNIRTDMQLWEMKRMYEIARNINQPNVHSAVLTTGPGGVLVGTTEVLGGAPASVLKTRTGDYSEIHQIAATIFETGDTMAAAAATPTPEPEATPTPEVVRKPTVEIRNATSITGLAQQTSETLEAEEYEVLAIGNAATRDVEQTVVYVLDDEVVSSASSLADLLGAATDSGLPSSERASEAEVLIILGADQE